MLKRCSVYLGFVVTVSLSLLTFSCLPEEAKNPYDDNRAPVVHGFNYSPNDSIDKHDTVSVACVADDPDGDLLSYT